MEVNKYQYLIIKKKWLHQQEYWTDGRKVPYGRMGINIPLVIYEHLASRKSMINELVICISNEENAFYSTTFNELEKFARKHYTVHKEPWDDPDEVIGVPFGIFKRI